MVASAELETTDKKYFEPYLRGLIANSFQKTSDMDYSAGFRSSISTKNDFSLQEWMNEQIRGKTGEKLANVITPAEKILRSH